MKRTIVFILFFIFAVILPQTASAHGGVEKGVGNILVTLFQTPLSPLVGENVNFAFILTDSSKAKFLKNKTAQLVVTQTTTGDPSADKVVYTKKVISDVNGTITFSYTFPKTNYYDIDLEFGKPGDETNTTGFLVQPREDLQPLLQILGFFVIVSILLNIVLGIRLRIKKKNNHT